MHSSHLAYSCPVLARVMISHAHSERNRVIIIESAISRHDSLKPRYGQISIDIGVRYSG